MAEIDSRNARLQSYISDVQDIKDKIKEIALSQGVSIDYGTDTPLSLLTKIKQAI